MLLVTLVDLAARRVRSGADAAGPITGVRPSGAIDRRIDHRAEPESRWLIRCLVVSSSARDQTSRLRENPGGVTPVFTDDARPPHA
jgi:hypothetical protein